MPADTSVTPFLMFTGQAEEAMNFYVATFENSRVLRLARHGPEGPGKEGSIYQAVFTVNGTEVMCIDSPPVHAFGFTPAMSLYVTSADEEKVARYFTALADGGQVLMPLGEYPFSRKYGWVQDRFGVSWQVSVR